MPEWLMGRDCNSFGFAFAGSNPARPKKRVRIEFLPTRKMVGSADKNVVFVTLIFWAKKFPFGYIYLKIMIYSLSQIW